LIKEIATYIPFPGNNLDGSAFNKMRKAISMDQKIKKKVYVFIALSSISIVSHKYGNGISKIHVD